MCAVTWPRDVSARGVTQVAKTSFGHLHPFAFLGSFFYWAPLRHNGKDGEVSVPVPDFRHRELMATAPLPHGSLGHELPEEWQGRSAGSVQHTQMFWCQPALGKSFFQ